MAENGRLLLLISCTGSAQSRSFEKMAAAESWGGVLTGGDRTEDVPGIRFAEGIFELLGVQPMIGRTFQSDDFKPGTRRTLVLGHSLWQRRFVCGRRTTSGQDREGCGELMG